MNPKFDIIFCSIPFSDLDHIYSAPAILKGVVESEGYTAKTIDFGLELFKLCNRDRIIFDNIQHYFYSADAILSNRETKILESWRESIRKFVKDHPARYYGISILHFMQQLSAYEICGIIREVSPESSIVIGGRGAKVVMMSEIHKICKMSGIEKLMSAGEFLKKRNKCDFVVIGDGEDPIVEILKDGKNSVITHEDQESFSYPEPNYEDYFLDQYIWESGEIAFPVTGSKGCVRDCDFCDVRFQFGKFKYRSGKDIANEMLSIQKKYGFNKFQFTDSLVNGGLKPFREFVTIIAEYNKKNPDNKIKWTGQYICRPELTMPKDLYKLMAESGAEGLTIGAESGSDHVLEEMNKKTTVEALLTELEEFRKYGITCVLLVMTAHWSESWDNFNEHCQTLIKMAPYMRDGTISAIQLGWLASMLDGTPGHERVAEGKIIVNADFRENVWYNKENPMDLKERLYRRLLVALLGKRLKMPTVMENQILRNNHEKFISHVDEINTFYDQYRENIQSPGPAETVFYNFDSWYNKLISSIDKDSVLIRLRVFSQECKGAPNIKITCNGNVHYDGELPAGDHNFEFEETTAGVKDLRLCIEMSGKNDGDTLVDADGNILEDKHILIKELFINNYNITADPDFVHDHLKEITGLWQNGKIEMMFGLPFIDWYNSVSNKNVNIASEMSTRNYPLEFSEHFDKLLSVTESLK
jgi:hypothetical protein